MLCKNWLTDWGMWTMKSELEIAKEVMQGKWGTGKAREKAIWGAGYDYNAVQAMVNQMILTGKQIAEIEIDTKDCCGVVVNLKV